ncbi:phage repressor protein [Halorubrum ezzemoulense]|nr:phage repressor protein [Halorubrum ezzemoulense]
MVKRDIREMVERVSWFSPIDYEILEFFEDHDILASPKVIGVNIDYDRQYTSKRCRVLLDEGLLDQAQSGIYKLSDRGRSFLAGEVDPDTLERS